MYIAKIPNRSSPPTYLLRESYQENGKVKNRTLANLSALPLEQIELLSRVLQGETLVPAGDAFRMLRSLPHGHVHAVLSMLRRLGLESLIANRDGRRDLPCIVYGVLTDAQGRPISVEVYSGNTGDPTTVPDQVEKLRGRFGLKRVILVGDRGMLTQAQINKLRERPGLGWLSVLRPESIRKLIEKGCLERSLFDERNLVEITSPDFPKERLVACFNPLLEDRRRRKRESLLAATEQQFARIAAEVARRRKKPLTKAEVGVKTGKVLNKYKVGKHFTLTIEDGRFSWQWHLKRVWAPLLFADEHLTEHRADRDPVAQAEPAAEVCRKKAVRRNEEGYPLNSFRTLLAALATQCRTICQFGDGESAIPISKTTDPSTLQYEAFRLLQQEL